MNSHYEAFTAHNNNVSKCVFMAHHEISWCNGTDKEGRGMTLGPLWKKPIAIIIIAYLFFLLHNVYHLCVVTSMLNSQHRNVFCRQIQFLHRTSMFMCTAAVHLA